MRHVLTLAVLILLPTVARGLDKSLPRSTPEAEGVSSSGISDFINTAGSEVDSIHSFMLVRNGKVIAEKWWGGESAEKPHILWSLTKSFTSTAVGLAQSEGKLSIDDPVLKYFRDAAPKNPSPYLEAMRIRDLLTMSCGHEKEVSLWGKQDWIPRFLAHNIPHKPGTHFQYNTPGSHMLSAIVQQATGETVQEYLQPRLFDPLGIERPKWAKSPEGESIGGYGLYLRTEDIAKFGQLYLQHGRWNDQQLIPAEWVKQATAKQVANDGNTNPDWSQGYGFQFWQCRHGACRGDGRGGQFCILLPAHNAVIAITSQTTDMQRELDIVWDKLLPAFQ